VHPGLSCEESRREQAIAAIGDAIIVQHCPYCDMPTTIPENCLHITCCKSRGGCGEHYCFACGAPRSPITQHADNLYHRPSCSFYSKGCSMRCATKDCYTKGQTTCSVIQYNEECVECKKLGRLCQPPPDPDNTGRSHCKIIPHQRIVEEVKKEQQKNHQKQNKK
jgi:hypothetical protein